MMNALGLDPKLGSSHPDIPVGKIAGMTTDTASVEPATSKLLAEKYALFKFMFCTPCFCHVGHVFLVDQSQVSSINTILWISLRFLLSTPS
jgi:hypothetical protein